MQRKVGFAIGSRAHSHPLDDWVLTEPTAQAHESVTAQPTSDIPLLCLTRPMV